MKKFLVTESEIKDIKSLYKSKGILLQEAITGVVPNWEAAEKWIMTQNQPAKGDWPTNNPDYHYAKYINNEGNEMEIQSSGRAQEFKRSEDKLIHNGTWKWNGKEVVFSWLAKKRAGDVWERAKKRLETNGVEDYKLVNPKTGFDQTKVTYNYGEWVQGGYNYAKLTQDFDGSILELEIRDNFTWRAYNRTDNNILMSGKWSWDGSKIVFARGVTKKSSGLLSDEDTDLNTAIMVKNKIGKIGAKGPAVKEIQWFVTDVKSGNQYGTGEGCGDDQERCTGIYDAKTKELVKKWQDNNGLKPDGLWGKESQRYYNDNPDEKEDESDID